MVRIGECSACQMGKHDRCQRVIQSVPEEMIGGAICGCKGECVERGPSKEIMKTVNLFRQASKIAKERSGRRKKGVLR